MLWFNKNLIINVGIAVCKWLNNHSSSPLHGCLAEQPRRSCVFVDERLEGVLLCMLTRCGRGQRSHLTHLSVKQGRTQLLQHLLHHRSVSGCLSIFQQSGNYWGRLDTLNQCMSCIVRSCPKLGKQWCQSLKCDDRPVCVWVFTLQLCLSTCCSIRFLLTIEQVVSYLTENVSKVLLSSHTVQLHVIRFSLDPEVWINVDLDFIIAIAQVQQSPFLSSVESAFESSSCKLSNRSFKCLFQHTVALIS